MREAVREYLSREEARESFAEEADDARRDYLETGLHATHAEVGSKLAPPGRHPLLGPVDPDRPETRELFVPFGVDGYVARYTIVDNRVVVLAIRHASEAGYSPGR